MIAVVKPSSTSTSGRARVGMKPWMKALYVSLIRRCDSAAIVSNTSELLPEPETPVNTVSRRLGSATLMSLRLLTRAPWTRIRSCESAGWVAASFVGAGTLLDRVMAPSALGPLVEPHEVAGGVAERAVPDAVGLVHRLLEHLGTAR